MTQIQLVVGPVGAGKSTFCRRLAEQQRAVHFNLDEWMARLFRADRPEQGVMEWYAARVRRCQDQIWAVSQSLLRSQVGVVLELGLLQREQRLRFYERVDAAGHSLKVYVLDAEREVRRARVMGRNEARGATFVMEVPLAIFELASDMWQQIDDEEAQGRDIQFIFTDVEPAT